MIEASDRLCQKLDEVAELFRQQIEAWRQIQPPTVPSPAAQEQAGHRAGDAPRTIAARPVEETPPPSGAVAPPPPVAEDDSSQEQKQHPVATATLPSAAAPEEEPAPDRPREAAAPLPSRAEAPPPADDGPATMAADALRLVDTLAPSGRAWPEQADGVQQALESIMTYLENQAATAPPKVDVDGIMSRLRDLEEQQQSLESRFNTSR